MEKIIKFLKDNYACGEAIEWATQQEDPLSAWEGCHRGDWMLWLAVYLGVDKKKITLATAHSANTVRHLMRDELSREAVDVAIAYGNGGATESELEAAVEAAHLYSYIHRCAMDNVDIIALNSAVYAGKAAFIIEDVAEAYAVISAISSAVYAAVYASGSFYGGEEKLFETAEICRKYLTEGLIKKMGEKGLL